MFARRSAFVAARNPAQGRPSVNSVVSGQKPLARNVCRLAHLDLPGGGQVMVQGNYAYVGHMRPPHGTSIIDVGDPRNPRVVSTIDLDGPLTHSHKARVVGDVMIVNCEQHNRHIMRQAREVLDRIERELGRPPTNADIAARLKVSEADLEKMQAAARDGYHACISTKMEELNGNILAIYGLAGPARLAE
jgi:hypothetical protein